jgi:hypothetical protein
METRNSHRPGAFPEEVTRTFLREHPEAKEALDLFGIADQQYQHYLAAQQPVHFFTSSSTLDGGNDGELE